MPFFGDQNIFQPKPKLSFEDYFTFTNANDGSLKTFPIQNLLNLFAITYTFSNAVPALPTEMPGYFFSEGQESDPAAASKLIFNNLSLDQQDLSGLFQQITLSGDFKLRLTNCKDPSNVIIFSCDNFESVDEHSFSVDIVKVFATGNLIDTKIYVLHFDLAVGGSGGGPSITPTLEQVRQQGNSISGDINANGNTITNLKDAVDPSDAVPLAQAEALDETILTQANTYADDQDLISIAAANAHADEGDAALAESIAARSLEDVRAVDNQVEGDIELNGHNINGSANASSPQQLVTLAQLEAASAASAAYAESLSVNAIRILGDYDIVALNAYPATGGSGSGGAIRRNDGWRVPSSATPGTFHGVYYAPGDIIYSLQATPGQVDANWSSLDYNTQQATELAAGVMKVADDPTVSNENSLNDTDAITTKKLWLSFWARVKAISHTFAAKITFTTAPRFSSMTAGAIMKVDTNKDLAPAIAGTDYQAPLAYTPENAANKDTSNGYVGLSAWKIKVRNLLNTATSFIQTNATSSRTWTLQDKDGTLAHLADLPKLILFDVASYTSSVGTTTEQILSSNPVTGFKANSLNDLDWRIVRVAASNSATIRVYISTVNNDITSPNATLIGFCNSTGPSVGFNKFSRQLTIDASGVMSFVSNTISMLSDSTIVISAGTVTLPLTLPGTYYIITTIQTSSTGNQRQDAITIKQFAQ